jgi:hypothetical protein
MGKYEVRGNELKFKAEMFLLLMAIVLFAVSAFFYSHQSVSEGLSLASLSSYPYRGYAVTFVGFGSALMLVASISYSKRSKILE